MKIRAKHRNNATFSSSEELENSKQEEEGKILNQADLAFRQSNIKEINMEKKMIKKIELNSYV